MKCKVELSFSKQTYAAIKEEISFSSPRTELIFLQAKCQLERCHVQLLFNDLEEFRKDVSMVRAICKNFKNKKYLTSLMNQINSIIG